MNHYISMTASEDALLHGEAIAHKAFSERAQVDFTDGSLLYTTKGLLFLAKKQREARLQDREQKKAKRNERKRKKGHARK